MGRCVFIYIIYIIIVRRKYLPGVSREVKFVYTPPYKNTLELTFLNIY